MFNIILWIKKLTEWGKINIASLKGPIISTGPLERPHNQHQLFKVNKNQLLRAKIIHYKKLIYDATQENFIFWTNQLIYSFFSGMATKKGRGK